MIHCPNCGTANQKGSHFCNECGEPLPRTGVLCPMCGSVNPVRNVFCSQCNARLVPLSSRPGDEEEEDQRRPIKGLSLPTIPLNETDEEARGAIAGGGEESASEDWLDALRVSANEEAETADIPSEGDDIGPHDDSDAEPIEPAEIPDWLRDLSPIDQGSRPSPAGEADSPLEALEDEATSEESGSSQSGSLQSGSSQSLAEEPPLEAADIPEWLRSLEPREADTIPEDMIAPEDDAVLEPPDFPDWLYDLGPLDDAASLDEEAPTSAMEEPPAVEGIAPPAPEESAIRPWSSKETVKPEGAEACPEEPGEARPEGEEVPAWLQDVSLSAGRELTPSEATEGAPEEPVSASIEIPDWLKESLEDGLEPAESGSWQSLVEETFAPEGPPQLEGEAEEEVPRERTPESLEVPSWLEQAGKVGEETRAEEPGVPVTEEPPEALETPAWLTELLAQAPGAEDEGVPSAAGAVFDEREIDEGLARAEIPAWLQDLRPSDAEQQEAVRGPAETEGLLQGLRGLLPVSLAIEAPSTYEVRASVAPSEASLARAELLQSLLSQPIVGVEAERRESGSWQSGSWQSLAGAGASVERWFVAVVLLIAVLGTLLAPLVVRQAPLLTEPSETVGASQLYGVVDELGGTDQVWVAFDYGLPEADELNAVARPILEHVLSQGAEVTVVSTRPDGPSVASALMSEIADSPDQYALLGYRPGAVAAVSQLLTIADRPPGLLLVLTGRAAPLRRWVEQARAHYGDQLPVVLAGSAALEPAASPYVDTGAGQLRGSIHGLSGAASYEMLRGTRGDATQRLNALAAGHLAVIALTIVGAIFYGLKRVQGGKA